ncbi:hypothetical protein [Massilia sp. METH4]|uniref:tetratricopeptide repeat protein n=1 Tax=Massilia sp. METH4 TaxID=3123041 RepID=UPI0030CB2DDB
MTISTLLSRVGATAALAAALSACSTTPVVPPAPTLEGLLSEASKAADTGNKEQAVALWKQSAAAFPTEKTPWTHIAQTKYEAGQYGDAIQAALEVLVRDPNDQLANSIIAISGLRLSTRALTDLSRLNGLEGSTKSESVELAKLLRKTLGEDQLIVTPPAPQPEKRPTRTAKKGKTVKPAAAASPFDLLK